MRTARLQAVGDSVATIRFCSEVWGPQVIKFEQVSSVDHQMSVVGGQGWAGGPRSDVWGEGWGTCTMYSEVHGIMGNGHIGNP